MTSDLSLPTRRTHLVDQADQALPYAVPFFSDNRRTARRHLVRWRAKVYLTGGLVFEGVTNDLSEAGAAIFLDHNLCCAGGKVRVLLAIPAAAGLPDVKVAEAEARQVYSILDSTQKQFRVAFKFVKFHHGKEAMLRRLELSGQPISF